MKNKSCFYSLPESFPLKHVIRSLKSHFLHVEVCHLQHQLVSVGGQGTEICDHASDFNHTPSSAEVQKFVATTRKIQNTSRKRKRRAKRMFSFKSLLLEFPRAVHFLKRKKNKCSKRRRNIAAKNQVNGFQQGPLFSEETDDHFVSRTNSKWGKEFDENQEIECPSETLSETISVSGIIKRYFTNNDEVTSSSRFSSLALPTVDNEHYSYYQNRKFDMSLPLTPDIPPRMLHSQSHDQLNPKASHGTDKKNVGKRLIAASNNLMVYASKHSPTLSLCSKFGLFRDRGLSIPNSTCSIKGLVFDISDEDD